MSMSPLINSPNIEGILLTYLSHNLKAQRLNAEMKDTKINGPSSDMRDNASTFLST
jgi:hypothetical protein